MTSLLKITPDVWAQAIEAESGTAALRPPTPSDHRIIVSPTAAIAVVRREKSRNSTAGRAIELFPPGTKSGKPFAGMQDDLIIAFNEHRLHEQAEIDFAGEIEWPSRPIKIDDEKAKHFANMIREEFPTNRRLNRIYVNSLVSAFITCVARNFYAENFNSDVRLKGGLSSGNLRRVNDFISEHLAENISIDTLAKVVNLSPSHFTRAFRETIGQSPHQYIITQRVSYAEDLVVRSRLPLAEIARLAGFHSHSHMTATMRQIRGLTPTALRRHHWRQVANRSSPSKWPLG